MNVSHKNLKISEISLQLGWIGMSSLSRAKGKGKEASLVFG